MKRSPPPFLLVLLASAGMFLSAVQPASAGDGEQLSAAMKAADERNNELRERLKREREERRAEADRLAQENKANTPVEQPQAQEAQKPVIRRDTARIDAERKALEAERKAREAERRAQEAMARAEEAERQRLAMEEEQRAKEEAIKAAVQEALKKQQAQIAAAKAKAKVDDACIDPVGTPEEIARLCGGPAPAAPAAKAVAGKKDGPGTAAAPAGGGSVSSARK